MPSKHGDQKKNYVKFMYCTRPVSPEELAEETGVSTSTIYRWIKEGNWDDLRQLSLNSPWEMAIWFQKQLSVIRKKVDDENRQPTMAEIDQISKLSKSIQTLSGNIHYAQVTMDVFTRFISEMKLQDEELAVEIMPYITSFVERVTKEKSR